MAEKKSRKTNQNNRDKEMKERKGCNSLLLGVGIGAILLELAGIFGILTAIYFMISGAAQIALVIFSAILLLGAFVWVFVKVFAQKQDEQKQMYEELLQIEKATYMKSKKISGQVGEELAEVVGKVNETVTGIREDMAHVQQKQSEELYKRQMSIANVQIKRNQENMLAMLNSNDHMIEVMEQKLAALSNLDAYAQAVSEVQQSVAELYKLCEQIAENQAKAPVLEPAPENREIEPEIVSEPVGVNIEPLPKEVVENLTESEPAPEITPEPEPEPIAEEPEPEPAAMPEMSGDPNRQMTAEEIAAMFSAMEAPADTPAEEPEPEIAPEPEPEPIAEPEPEPEPEPAPAPEMSGDPNRQLTAEEIAALFSNV